MDSYDTTSNQWHDAMIRLFQDTVEVLLLRDLPPAVADLVRPRHERAWLEHLSVLTGLPAATRLCADAPSERQEPTPALTFHPSSRAMAELREAHREARRLLRNAATPADDLDARRVLAVLAAIGRGLREAGLWPAYVASARAMARRAET